MFAAFGGTFDPIHFGHLRVALDAVEALGLERLHLVPLNRPVHREGPIASGTDRMALLRAAIAGEPRFVADERELQRPGGSYSVDTLHSLREDYPHGPLCLLLGSDAFAGFLSWHKPHEILELAHLVVMQRPGYELPPDPQLREMVDARRVDGPDRLRRSDAGRILFLAVTQLDISATDIRERCASGRSPRYLVPDSVWQLIEKQEIYRGHGSG